MRNTYRTPALALAGLILFISASPAFAADPAPSGMTAMAKLGQLFAAIQDGLATLRHNAGIIDIAKRIAFALFGVVLTWGVVKSWLLGKGFMNLAVDLVLPTLMLGLILFAMQKDLGLAISKSVETIASVASGGATASPIDLMGSLMVAAFKVFDIAGAEYPKFLDIPGWLVIAIGMLVKIVVAFILFGCAAIAAGSFLLADVSLAIATGLGPVFYVWALWRPTEFLFQGWLKFLLTAAIQKLMVGVMATLVAAVVSSLGSLSATLTHQFTDLVAYAGVLLVGVISAHLMRSAAGLASSIVGAPPGISMSGWSAATSSMAAAAGGAAGAANQAGGSAVSGIAGGYTAMQNVLQGNAGAFSPSQGGQSSSGGGGGKGTFTATASGAAGSVGRWAAAGLARGVASARNGPPPPPPQPLQFPPVPKE
jgi:hypothetical protein